MLLSLRFLRHCHSDISLQLNQAVGSIEAIAKASKKYILQNTDLSADKAETISRFFRDPRFYMSPKINRSEKQLI